MVKRTRKMIRYVPDFHLLMQCARHQSPRLVIPVVAFTVMWFGLAVFSALSG